MICWLSKRSAVKKWCPSRFKTGRSRCSSWSQKKTSAWKSSSTKSFRKTKTSAFTMRTLRRSSKTMEKRPSSWTSASRSTLNSWNNPYTPKPSSVSTCPTTGSGNASLQPWKPSKLWLTSSMRYILAYVESWIQWFGLLPVHDPTCAEIERNHFKANLLWLGLRT